MPAWNINSSGVQTTVSFSFATFVTSDGMVSSTPNSLLLQNLPSRRATVTFSAPSGCTIGTANISPSNTYILINGRQYVDSSIINSTQFTRGLGANGAAIVKLQFQGVDPGAFGAVKCNNPGNLIYAY